jgi:hypothetical protein
MRTVDYVKRKCSVALSYGWAIRLSDSSQDSQLSCLFCFGAVENAVLFADSSLTSREQMNSYTNSAWDISKSVILI